MPILTVFRTASCSSLECCKQVLHSTSMTREAHACNYKEMHARGHRNTGHVPQWFGLFVCTIVLSSLSPSCHYIQFTHSQVTQAPPIQMYCYAKIHDTLGNVTFVTSPSFVSQPDPCSHFFLTRGFNSRLMFLHCPQSHPTIPVMMVSHWLYRMRTPCRLGVDDPHASTIQQNLD